ncbi:MAG TPA: ribosome biogenesis GTPase YlqF [Firmicutes bacterium]|nr:ribosome biogenesis GTPase YlqF [Bacillota bacterium]
MREGQWYPGNMARAINQLREDLKVVDLVIELLDARIPISSHNPLFARMLAGKKTVLLLHKADRADPDATGHWLSYFKKRDQDAISFSIYHKHSISQLIGYLKGEQGKKQQSRFKRPLRIMVVGVPNVGKSTLINYFLKKAVAKTGNQPGITRGRQWIRIHPEIELLDTPGILQPRITADSGYPLAAVGAISAGRYDLQNTAFWLINCFQEKGKFDLMQKRYPGIKEKERACLLEDIARSLGYLQSAGKLDLDRAAASLLRDFQEGALGRVTLEEVPSARNG